MTAYLLHGLTLSLAWFLIFDAAASAAVALAVRSWRDPIAHPGASSFWLAVRLSPAAASLLFVGWLFVPSYWRYEPRTFVEGFDFTLTTLAILAIVVFAIAAARGVRAWRNAARRSRAWMRAARPIALPGADIHAFEIDAETPMLALVGIVHPRLLITRSVVAALTPAELAASLAHEMEHSSSWDNLKRLLIRASPDLLAWTATARTIERRWAAASEHNADRRAAADGPAARCALASALVKIARMMTLAASTPTKGKAESFWGRRGEPICTLVDGGDITTRVERLLADAAPASDRRLTTTAVGVGIAGAIACTTVYAPLLRIVHTATEILVNSLP